VFRRQIRQNCLEANQCNVVGGKNHLNRHLFFLRLQLHYSIIPSRPLFLLSNLLYNTSTTLHLPTFPPHSNLTRLIKFPNFSAPPPIISDIVTQNPICCLQTFSHFDQNFNCKLPRRSQLFKMQIPMWS
jgi:hypothetical protein